MVLHGCTNDITIIFLLLKSSNTNAHQYGIDLGITDSSSPWGDFRQRNTNAGFIFNCRESGDWCLNLSARTEVG